MKPKYLNFDQLVKENKQELLENEKELIQIEDRLEKKQMDLVFNKRKDKLSV